MNDFLSKDVTIPQPYRSVLKDNFKVLEGKPLSDESLTRYFNGCFNDIYRMAGLYKTWVCVKCLSVGRYNYGWGDKPTACDQCGNKVYEVATFQARASYVGNVFDYGCQYILNEKYNISTNPTSESTHLYDFEIRFDIVIECKGSPKYVLNPDGTRSNLTRAGMLRTDTEKKAFANAKKWHNRFPNGSFYVLTNAVPNHLRAYRNETIKAIFDFTKKRQVDSFVSEVQSLIDG